MTKDEILALAQKSLTFQMETPNTSLSLLRYFQWLTPYYAFIYLLCQRLKPETMVELGTECGMGCIHMALGNPYGQVWTYDIHNLQEQIWGYSFFAEVGNIEMIIKDSVEAAQVWNNASVDLLFIDGDHRYEYARKDYRAWLPKVKSGGLILIDDTQLSKDMEQFWAEIEEPKFDLNFIRWKDPHRPGRGAGFGVVMVP